MALLDELLKQVAGGALSGQSGRGGGNVLLDAVVGMVTNQKTGGLGGLLQSFAKKGLGDIFSSWIGTGRNQDVSPAQIKKALSRKQVKEISKKTGLDKGTVLDSLSTLLPEVVNQMTPKGSAAPEDQLSGGLDALRKIFG